MSSNIIKPKSSFENMNMADNLAQRQKAISESVSGFSNQMVNPIKSTVSEIKAGVAIIKDTDKAISQKLYNYKSEAIDSINDYLNALTGGKINFNDFGNVLSYKDGFKVDSDELLKIAGKSLGFNINNITDMKKQLGQSFINELNDMTLGLSDGLFQVGYDGEFKIAGDWDKTTGQLVFDFLERGSDTFGAINNFAATNAILNTMVYKNAEIGYSNGFYSFGEMYLYRDDYYGALINSIEILINNGDIDSLNEVLKILDTESRYKVRSKYPNFTETVLINFRFPNNVLEEEYDIYLEKLLKIIEEVDGKDWNLTNTFMGDILNVGLVSKISEDSYTLLQRKEELIPFLCCSGIYEEYPANLRFRRDFPDSVIL